MTFAERCGIDLDAFQDYLEERRAEEPVAIDPNDFPLLRDTSAVADDVDHQDLLAQQREAFLAGMDLFEWREHIADLQADAAMQGE
jgi:hypothetical protein